MLFSSHTTITTIPAAISSNNLADRSFIPPLTQSIQTHLLSLTTRHRSISHILAEYKMLSERFGTLDEEAIQLLSALGLDVEGMDGKEKKSPVADNGTASSSTNAIRDLDILTSTIESTSKSLDDLTKTLEEKSGAMDEVEETMGKVVPLIVRPSRTISTEDESKG